MGPVEKGLHGLGAGVHCRSPKPCERQMREAVRHDRGEALELLPFTGIECTQLALERARDFLGGDLLERAAQLREARPDGAQRKLGPQPRQALVDRGAYRRKTHELREPAPAGGFDEVVHSEAGEPGMLRGLRLDVGRDAEIDEER